MTIIYKLWMYDKEFNHETYSGSLYYRRKDITSNVPIFMIGMKIRTDGGIFEIESMDLDLDYSEEYDSKVDIEQEIEIEVYVKFDDHIIALSTANGSESDWLIQQY